MLWRGLPTQDRIVPYIHIEDRLEPIQASDGETLLSALKRAGVPIGYSCESGQCGTCKCELLAGEPREAGHAPFALSEAQRARGIILACRSEVVEDLRIRILDADELESHPPRQMRCELIALSLLSRDVWKLVFRILEGGPFVFSAGQYAKITFLTPDGDPLARDFSIASTPAESEFDGLIEFHIRAAAGANFTRLLEQGALPLGKILTIAGPEGTSYLRPRFAGPMLLVAGGSGLAPILSIAASAVDAGMSQPIHVYVGMRDESDVYGEQRLHALAARAPALRYTYVLSEPSTATARRTGLVSEAIAADFADLSAMKAYLAGPPVMVESTVALLRDRGMIERNIHTDAYYAARPAAGQT